MRGSDTKPEIGLSYPSAWRVALRGLLLGIAAAYGGACLLWISVLVYVWLQAPTRPLIGSVGYFLLVGAATIVVFFLFALIPGAIGGGIIALILHSCTQRKEPSSWTSYVVGVLIGALSGSVTVCAVKLLVPDKVQEAPEGIVMAIGIAAIAGLWHSWQMRRWLR